MNIHGFKLKLKKARDMIRREERKKRQDKERIKSIRAGMRNTTRKINKLREARKKKEK